MILKKFRLKEKEVKKVLSKWKPFFSYNIVLNFFKNDFFYPRFAIVFWGSSFNNNVERNFFRRKFYELVRKNYLDVLFDSWNSIDLVFVVKKQTKLDKKDEKSIKDFEKDIDFLIEKLLNVL